MNSSTGSRAFDIRFLSLRAVACLVFAGLVMPFEPSPGQSLDSTVEDEIESDVSSSVEDDVQEAVESDVTDGVEQQVESEVAGSVEDSVEQTVESDVAGAVEDTVESDVAGSVEEEVQQTVESDVTGSVEEQVESDVAGAVEDTVESDVAGSVEEEVQQAVESDITATVEDEVGAGVTERQVESSVGAVAEAVGPSVTGTVESGVAERVRAVVETHIESDLVGRLGDDLDDALEQLTELVEELEIEDVDEALERAVEFASGERGSDEDGDAADGADGPEDDEAATPEAERFPAGVDALGRRIESEVWVVLVPNEYADRIAGWGFEVRERRDLAGLDRVLLRVDAPGDRDIVQAALELALDAPGTSVDFNHVYSAEQGASRAAGAAARVDASARSPRNAGLEIGIVDSRIATGHEALAGARISERDFVAFEGRRPTAHGTAVASILVGRSGESPGVVEGASLHAASVFFETEAGDRIATTDGLVSALEWLAGRRVRVVNMSLSGPPNRVLETAIEEATARETVIVAAVGNNGPAAEPLYPAAYPAVVGVTAVDSDHHVYRYASRGAAVMFAAPGVDVRVAVGEGGFAERSGTSMAAPYAAAVITRSLAGEAAGAAEVLERLKDTALDLGEPRFDETYGYGLIMAALD